MRTVGFIFLGLLSAQLLPNGGAEAAEPRTQQPVFVYLYSRLDDHLNFPMTYERLQHELAMLERYRKEHPNYRPSALFQFNGAMAQALADLGASHVVDSILEHVRDGTLEIGYEGSGEPTHFMIPRPNFRNALTSEQRWLARGDAVAMFLSEYKHPVTGEPDPRSAGGLKRTQEIFGNVAAITGIMPWEIGADSETAHQIRRYNEKAILAGLPENTTWAARNLNGYAGAVATISTAVSPGPDFTPELFWQDGFLRMSETSGPQVHVVAANAGPEALQKRFSELDRSRPHVIRIELANVEMYLKPDFNRGVLDPLRFRYENPKLPALPPTALQSREEVDRAYAREEALMGWLVTDFFPANPGSHFVSASDLERMAQSRTGAAVSREDLAKAAAGLLEDWKLSGSYPPNFARAADDYFSLADMFQLLATSLAEFHRTGALPASVLLRTVYGPIDLDQGNGPATGSVRVADVARVCAQIAEPLNHAAWRPLPDNMVPSRIKVGDFDVNAAQFLRLMAEAVITPTPERRLGLQAGQMSPAVAFSFPTNRRTSEEGGLWTLKPARLTLLE